MTLALQWCNTNKSKLSKIDSDIKFKLLKQQFIQLFKSGDRLEVVRFARDNFSTLSENTKEIEELMLLLAVKPEYLNTVPKIKVIITLVT